MERTAVYVHDMESLGYVVDFLQDGWLIDPELKVIRLDYAALYHLVHYSEEELEVMQQSMEEKIVSIKSVSIDEADDYLKQGYEIKDTYAKTVTLIKKEVLGE